MKKHLWLLLPFISFFASCTTKENTSAIQDPGIFHQSVKAITDIIVHDIFSPPVASRIYVYSSIAAYEAGRWQDSSTLSLAGQLHELKTFPQPKSGEKLCFPCAATLAFLKIGKALTFSEDSIQLQIDAVKKHYKSLGVDHKVLQNSEEFADKTVSHVLEWAGKDNYKQTRSFPKYSLEKDPATWKPTPPGYMDGIEPSWNKIRTFVIDSAQMFAPPPPTPYNITDQNSQFYQEVMEVYQTVKNLNQEQKDIANFWDCNPYKLNITGHVMHAVKKITPGGHWINIVHVASEKADADFITSLKSYALVSLCLADGFISCWDEKYRSRYVRPETVINEFVDQQWLPLLQTPPFPEYTSGHSVISNAAAEAMTKLYGENFSFVDSTEIEFGLSARSFRSFYHAADEAAISRLYGGIHFKPAIVNGSEQGKKLGKYIVEKIKFE